MQIRSFSMTRETTSLKRVSGLALLLAACIGLSAAAEPAVSMFRGSAERTGVYATRGVKAKPRIKWRFKTGGPVNSSPIVANGLVYAGSDDGCFYAVRLGDGKLAWKFKTGNDGGISP